MQLLTADPEIKLSNLYCKERILLLRVRKSVRVAAVHPYPPAPMENPVDRAIRMMMIGVGVVSLIVLVVFNLA